MDPADVKWHLYKKQIGGKINDKLKRITCKYITSD